MQVYCSAASEPLLMVTGACWMRAVTGGKRSRTKRS